MTAAKPRRLAVGLGLLLALLTAGWYLGAARSAAGEQPVMPLDDTYIHFQYARQMAAGQPFVYNPGQPPTSGATSFLYTPLLAVGYGLGLQGLNLAYWAVVLGLSAHLLSGWLVWRLVAGAAPSPRADITGGGLALSYVIGGPFLWAALSGMETALFTLTVLLALYAYQQGGRALRLMALVLVALARPEGAIIALLLGAALAWQDRAQRRRAAWPIGLAGLAALVQPVTNWLVTGSPSATGNQAKSILYNASAPLQERLLSVTEQWGRLWWELLVAYSPVDGLYMAPLLPLALLAVGLSVRGHVRQRIPPALLVLGWWLAVSAAVATLDTAFWHFKRYQIPLMALMFPLAGWGLLQLEARWPRLVMGLLGLTVLVAGGTALTYQARYAANVGVVAGQQLPMARWVADNLPPEAVVAVHDVGVMRYVGERTTYDIVGLTTPGVAPAWRQGPGTLYETLRAAEPRPDYFAVYPDIQGLPLLVEAGVYGDELRRFHYPLPPHTAASATATQVVTRPDWATLNAGDDVPHQASLHAYLAEATLLETVNVAQLASEEAADYVWWNDATPPGGFLSLPRHLTYRDCAADPCQVTDGGRLLNGGERFNLPSVDDDAAYLVVLRLHAAQPARLTVGCDAPQQIKIVPSLPGHWVEIPVLLPGETEQFCLSSDGPYEIHRYWMYRVPAAAFTSLDAPSGDTFQATAEAPPLILTAATLRQDGRQLHVGLDWFAAQAPPHDGKLFIHLYSDPNQPPLRQIDTWPAGGALPPANWLPGPQTGAYTLDMDGLPPGTYPVAIGLYDPATGRRYTVNGQADRLFIGEVEVPPAP